MNEEEFIKEHQSIRKEMIVSVKDMAEIIKQIGILATDKWIRIEEIHQTQLDRTKILKNIDKLIVHRDNERKNNNIFRQTSDELNEHFIDNLEALKKELGLQ